MRFQAGGTEERGVTSRLEVSVLGLTLTPGLVGEEPNSLRATVTQRTSLVLLHHFIFIPLRHAVLFINYSFCTFFWSSLSFSFSPPCIFAFSPSSCCFILLCLYPLFLVRPFTFNVSLLFPFHPRFFFLFVRPFSTSLSSPVSSYFSSPVSSFSFLPLEVLSRPFSLLLPSPFLALIRCFSFRRCRVIVQLARIIRSSSELI